MTAITREFRLYTNAGLSIPPVIHVNQYDQGETWNFKLYQPNGQQFIPTDAAIVGVKADGNLIANAGTVSDGVVVITETEQITAAPGKAVFEILFDGDTHGTANFVVLVEASPTNDGVASESDLSLFQEAIDSTSPAAIAQGVSAWMSEHLTPTTPVVDDTLTVQGAAADAKKTGDEISDLKSAIATGGGFNAEVKQALMNLANAVAFKSNVPLGQTLIDALEDALYPPVDLVSISAVYTQSGTVYDTDSLDSLKADLVVTAHYDDYSTETVTSYVLSGNLTAGTSTITVTYGGKTTTFSVTVTAEVPAGYTKYDYITYTGDTTAKQATNTIRTAVYDNLNDLSVELKCAATNSFSSTGQAILGGRTESGATSSKAFYMANDGFGLHAHGTDLTPKIGGTLVKGNIYTVKYTEKSASPSLYEVGNSSANVAWTNSNTINTAFTLLNNPTPNSNIWFVEGIQIGKIKLFDVSGTLIAEYTPCVRDSDSVIGIYDSVGEAFYTAATAASATIGNTGCLYSVGNWS